MNHFVEFCVVIIGILIAFQLNTCAEEKKHNRTIDIHLEEIIKEAEFNKQSLQYAISATESNLSKIDSLLQLIDQDGSVLEINQLSLALLRIGGVYLRKNAYAALVESGDLGLIRDFYQKQDIVNLYEYYKWVEAFDEISITGYQTDFYPYLLENLDMVKGKVQNKEVYHSKKFFNLLGAYRFTSQNKLNKYEDCLTHIEEYIDKQSKEGKE